MFLKTKEFIDFLYKWKCIFKKFYLCVIDLSEQMATNNFWDKSEIKSINNWLDDLTIVGYIEPNITNFNYELSSLNIQDFLLNGSLKFEISKESFRVKYTPEFQTPIDFNNYFTEAETKLKSNDKIETVKYFKNYCKSNYNLSYNVDNIDSFQKKKDITLLITFNHFPSLENIKFLYKFHLSYFKKIIFCGRDILSIFKSNEIKIKKFDNLTLLEYNTYNGYLHQYCMSKVIDMNLKTKGILLMSDDVLLKHWNPNELNINEPWYINKPNCFHDLFSSKKWPADVLAWMNSELGFEALRKTSSYFDKVVNKTIKINAKDLNILKQYLTTYN